MYALLYRARKNGFVFIHAIILWRYQDEYSRTAVDETYQPNPLKSMKQNVPWEMAKSSYFTRSVFYSFQLLLCAMVDKGAYLNENQYMEDGVRPHIGNHNTCHYDQRADHEALAP